MILKKIENIAFFQKIRDFLLLFSLNYPQAENPWKEIHHITKRLQSLSRFLFFWLFFNAITGILVVMYLGDFPFALSLFVILFTIWAIFIFIRNRVKGQKLYKKFSVEVSEREASHRSIRIPKDKQALLKNYLRYSDIRLIKGASVIFGVAFILIYAPKEVINIRRPYETVEQRLEKSIQQKQKLLQELQEAKERGENSALQIKRSMEHYQQLLYKLDVSLGKNYTDLQNAKSNYYRYAQLLNNPPSPENLLSQGKLKNVKAEIEGALRLELYRAGDNEDKAVAFLKNPEKIKHGIQLLLRRYKRLETDINNATYRDQIQIQMANQFIEKNQKALKKLEVSLNTDKNTIALLEKELHKEKQNLAKRQKKSLFNFTSY